MGIESTGFQTAIYDALKKHSGIPAVKALFPEGKGKMVRAIPTIIRCEAGQVYLPESAPWKEDFVAECVQLAYQFGQHVRAHVGYTFLYWSNVARAGDQIDLAVNPALLPPPLPEASPLRPAFTFHGTGLWAQGIDLGLEFRF